VEHIFRAANDLVYLPEIEPPTWGNLAPRFQKFIQAEHCFPVKLTEGNRIIGIGTTICHEDSAWLACIIVHPEFRNKGLGKLITDYLVDSLDKNQFRTIYLIATDLGFPVYTKLGFEVEAEYFHLKIEELTAESSLSTEIISYREEFKDQMLNLDRAITGEFRFNSLREHIKTSLLFLIDGTVEGYYLPSLGEGHILARTSAAGTALLKARLQNSKLAIFPRTNQIALDLVNSLGFFHYATSRRMVLGQRRELPFDNNYNRIGGHLG